MELKTIDVPYLPIFEWTKTKVKQPKMLPIPCYEELATIEHYIPKYLTVTDYGYEVLPWFNGWNCGVVYDAKRGEVYVTRKLERKDVIAWAEIPPYPYSEDFSDDGEI